MSDQIAQLLDKNQTLDKYMQSHFNIDNMDMDTVYQRNMPEYTSVMHNFQDFLVTMDRADWKKRLTVKSETDYYNSDNQKRKI